MLKGSEIKIEELLKNRETKIQDLINHINFTYYKGSLKCINVVSSVNCKEWEEEKNYLSEFYDEMETLSATRYYFRIDNNNVDENEGIHLHEGHIDFRPTGTISDAFLPILEKDRFFVTCRKSYKSDDPSNPTILTVPYATPDPQISLCSPQTLWIVLATLCNEFGKDYISLNEINSNLPPRSRGAAVGLKEYTGLFEKCHFATHFYSGARKKEIHDYFMEKLSKWEELLEPDDYDMINNLYCHYRDSENDSDFTLMDSQILYAYVESEIPVYLVFEAEALAEELSYKGEPVDCYHSVVAIGHTLDEKNNLSSFIIHDVNHSPFVEISEEFVNKNLVEAVVLLPKDVNIKYEYFLRFSKESNFASCNETIEKLFSFYNSMYGKLSSYSPLKIRPLLMRSQRIKFWFTNKNLYPPEICDMYSKADFPRYVWFFEIWDLDLRGNRNCIGHIVFDATISKSSTGLVLLNLPKLRVWSQNKEKVSVTPEIPTFKYLHPFRYPYSRDGK